MNFQILGKIVKVNLKNNFLIHLMAAALILFSVPFIMSISALNETQAARPVEWILSLVGMIFLTPIFYPEQNESICDVVRSKKMDYLGVCMIRVIYSVVFLALVCGGFTYALYLCESEVTLRHFLGGFASALFLGTVGFFGAGISKNVIAGYMTALLYYMANVAMKKQLGIFYLFSMTAGEGLHEKFENKYLLILTSVLLMIFVFLYKRLTEQKKQ